MIIDFLNNFNGEEQKRIIEMAERWHAYRHRRNSSLFDLYKKFPDAPYYNYSRGVCADPKCTNTDHSECEHYVDIAYEIWFDDLILDDEKEELKEMEQLVKKQRQSLKNDSEWDELYANITLDLLKWLNEKEITYCLLRNIPGEKDYLFVKNFHDFVEYRLKFDTPSLYDVQYAIDSWGWKKYSIYELTKISNIKQKKVIKSWIYENKSGIIHILDNDTLLMENEIDAMALKLRWNEFENV